ncbi:MAG: hypothetical protein MUC50_20150, partial [Myxococcota bacterium]|nr:hypothetical protein [Myxococcota bacterium]
MNGFFTHQRALWFAFVRRPGALAVAALVVALELATAIGFERQSPYPVLLIALVLIALLFFCFRPFSTDSRTKSLSSTLPIGTKTRYAAEAALLLPFAALLAPFVDWQVAVSTGMLAFVSGMYLAAWSQDDRTALSLLALFLGTFVVVSAGVTSIKEGPTALMVASVTSAILLVIWPFWLKWKERSPVRKKDDALDWAIIAALSFDRPPRTNPTQELWRTVFPWKVALGTVAVVTLVELLDFIFDSKGFIP